MEHIWRRDDDSPAGVSQIVSANKGERFPLKKPAGATLREARLEDTVYKDNFLVVNGWGKFYLPKVVTMQVIGVVEGISFPCEQLVLMTCEDQRVYAYDEEELHLVASSMKQLGDEGMEYPGSTVYYRGEAFKDMSIILFYLTLKKLTVVHHFKRECEDTEAYNFKKNSLIMIEEMLKLKTTIQQDTTTLIDEVLYLMGT
uniref:Uncharacterized protein n=1 Tax=Haplochromis burtoni TaxID=8153 RepID=A0A3Q2V709_HAPBU